MSKRVLIVDDSALVRKQLAEIIDTLGYEIEFAKNGKEAVSKALDTQYDVITMDINMPIMDGIEAVKIIMKEQPTSILMISSLTTADASITMDALDYGAIDYIAKPGTMNVGKNENRDDILAKVASLARIPSRRLKRQVATPARERKRVASKKSENSTSSLDISKVVLIGSSTGGPRLIEQICASIPQGYPYPVCIVQHMPAQFGASFAQRLNRSSIVDVIETKHNMEIQPGSIYLARGGVHLNFAKKVSGKVVVKEKIDKGEHFFQPAVDEMMFSAVDTFGAVNLVGVLLTGIGSDGADAMVSIKKGGGHTLGESEESATVYGMPKEAYDRGGVSEQLDFTKILKKIAVMR